MPTLQHPYPRLLKQILGQRPVGGQKEKIAIQPRLILRDQPIENIRVAAAKSLRESFGIVGHCSGEAKRPGKGANRLCVRRHTILYTASRDEKTQARWQS